MTPFQFQKFIQYLQKQNHQIIGPKRTGDKLLFTEINEPKNLVLTGELCFYPPKKYFLPEKESLFNYKKSRLTEILPNIKPLVPGLPKFSKQAIFGLTPYDLKGILLYHQVFEKDIYFQERIKNTLIIGQSPMPCDSKDFCFWEDDFEEDLLEHLKFDLYLGVTDSHGLKTDSQGLRLKRFKVYTGSEAGQKVLDKFGYKNYEHIDYVGPLKEQGLDQRTYELKEAVKNSNPEFWQELGKICLACGKCALVCPMCFCFDITDKPSFNSSEGRRVREWTTCFYEEFSQISGGHQFLDKVAKRIHFWYEHKFVRLPTEFGFTGCTGCGRCIQVCPVGINIQSNLERIVKPEAVKSQRSKS